MLAIVGSIYYLKDMTRGLMINHSEAQLRELVPVRMSAHSEFLTAHVRYRCRVDAVRFGIQELSPKFFGSRPDFVVSGPNVGST